MKEIWNKIKDYVYIVLIVVIVRTFIATPAIVDGYSMNDNLDDGQLVLVNKFIYRFDDIERFDVVVIDDNEYHDKLIKRVIALPNETIKYVDNQLFINGNLIKTDIPFKDTEDFEYTTKDNEYFCLGDNRPNSSDSRYYGPFNRKEIIGRVKIRLFPFSKAGNIK